MWFPFGMLQGKDGLRSAAGDRNSHELSWLRWCRVIGERTVPSSHPDSPQLGLDALSLAPAAPENPRSAIACKSPHDSRQQNGK